MSGFLITGILMDTKLKPAYYRNFIGRRIVRVFPLYYLCLLILFFLVPRSWIDLTYYRENQAWFWLYAENWLYSLDGWPKVKALHHFWSLAIEEQFYIVWPFVVWVFSSRGLLRFCIYLFFFSILFRNTGMYFRFVMPFPYVATLGRMEGITLGAIIAILIRTDKYYLEKYTYPITVFSAILSIAAFIIAGTMMFENPVHFSINYTLVDIFFAGMITMTMCDDRLLIFKKLLNMPLIKQIGIMSYCLYIFHYPIQNIIQINFQDYFQEILHSVEGGKLICLAIALTVTIPVVYFLHIKVELPFWKMRKYF